MSTNTTSRAMTWRPRYAWIPVSTRHIRNGAHMSESRSLVMGYLSAWASVFTLKSIVPRYVSVPFMAPTAEASTATWAPASCPTRSMSLRPLLDGAHLHEPESREEVDPHGVPDHHRRALVGLERLVPAAHGLLEARQELLAVALESGALLGSEAREAFQDVLGDGRGQARVERVVRVALRMHIAHRAVDPRLGHLEDVEPPRGVDASRRAGDDIGVVRALGDHVRPAVQLEAVDDQGVGAPHLDHEARAHLQIVRVLVRSRHGVHFGEVARDGLGQRLEIGGARDDAELLRAGGRGGGRPRRGQRQDQDQESSHGRRSLPHQNGCAGCAPMMKVAWRKYSLTCLALPPLSWNSR